MKEPREMQSWQTFIINPYRYGKLGKTNKINYDLCFSHSDFTSQFNFHCRLLRLLVAPSWNVALFLLFLFYTPRVSLHNLPLKQWSRKLSCESRKQEMWQVIYDKFAIISSIIRQSSSVPLIHSSRLQLKDSEFLCFPPSSQAIHQNLCIFEDT